MFLEEQVFFKKSVKNPVISKYIWISVPGLVSGSGTCHSKGDFFDATA